MSAWHIVGLHGLGNKPAGDVLAARWLAAIREGLARNEGRTGPDRFSFELIYWAGLRDPRRAPETPEFPANAYTPYPGTGKLPEYRESWMDQTKAFIRGTGGGLMDFIGSTFGRDIVSDDLLTRIEDLDLYYRDDVFRQALRGQLAAALTPQPEKKTLLIAHSMGTIIAMDVLRAAEQTGRPFPIDCLVTIGSPLGLPYIVYRQREEFGAARTPAGVEAWSNFSEKRDRICFDPFLAGDYAPNAAGVKVVDDLVLNTVENDRHQAFGYLRTPELSRLLARLIN